MNFSLPKKNKYEFISCLFFFLLTFPIFAQFDGVLTPTESRCVSSGTIVLSNANPNSLYVLNGNGIPPINVPANSTSFTFVDLEPGVYTCTEFKSDNTEVDAMSVVPGNYEQNWQFTVGVNFLDCNNGMPGMIEICVTGIIDADPSQQRPPYTYRISDPNGSLPLDGNLPPPFGMQNCWTFDPSVQGSTFDIQSMDSCGNFKTFFFTVPFDPPPPALNVSLNGYANCDGDAFYKLCASGGSAPYDFEVLSGPDQVGDKVTGVTCADYVLKANSSYQIAVTDKCGGTFIQNINTATIAAPCVSYSGAEGSCSDGAPGTGAVNLSICQQGIGPYKLEVTSDCGFSLTVNDVPPGYLLNNLPRPCNYTVVVTDSCGNTATTSFHMAGPGEDTLSCSFSFSCPPGPNDTVYQVTVGVNFGPPYSPAPPYMIDILKNGTSLPGYPKSMLPTGQVLQPLPASGDYSFMITDGCGATCSGVFTVPTYTPPTVTLDQSQMCFGAGQALLCGVNGNSLNPTANFYTIVAPSTDNIGRGADPDSPTGKGKFNSLTSGGMYTFAYNDGCQTKTITATIPTYMQPTWEVGYGVICIPNTTANLQVINIQPAGQIVGPYRWRIIAEDSDIFNDPLPYPDQNGQTDSVFANLPAKDNSFNVATYQILGFDGCGNSYQNSGKVGLFPDETLNAVFNCANNSIKLSVSTPIVGATYEFYRDGQLLLTSNKLFNTITPAVPGSYSAKVIVGTPPNTCEKETGAVVVDGIDFGLEVMNPSCSDGAPSNNGSISLTMVNGADKYGQSNGPTYTGPNYSGATPIPTLPAVIKTNIPNSGATCTFRFFDGSNDCYRDSTLVISPVACCETPVVDIQVTKPTCNCNIQGNNGSITMSMTNGDKYGISSGSTYNGPNYANATAINSDPQVIQSNIPNTGGTYTIRVFNGGEDCSKDITVAVDPVICNPLPAFSTQVSEPTCSCNIPNNNGSIQLLTVSDGDRYGISLGNAYSGPNYSGATIVGALPATIQTGVPNAGATYTIRVFNQNNECYTDKTITFNPVLCPPLPEFKVSHTLPTCTCDQPDNNGYLTLLSVSDADRFGVSAGSTYTGPAYASASAVGAVPMTLLSNIPNTGGAYTIRFFNAANACYHDTTILFAPKICPVITFEITFKPQTCFCEYPQNDGVITLVNKTWIDKFGVSEGSTYTGPNYANATPVGSLPQILKQNIPNTGKTYTFRFFNMEEMCHDDTTIVVVPVDCPPVLVLGDKVFHDKDNNCKINPGDSGLEGIEVALYTLGKDGLKNTKDDKLIATTLTVTTGHYKFEHLYEGWYWVKLTGKGIPWGYVSSTGDGPMDTDGMGSCEPSCCTDDDLNNNDDGTSMGMTGAGMMAMMIMSDPIHLTCMGEPVDDGDSNPNTNLTVDFGLYKAPNAVMTVGDIVFDDTNNDGLLNPDEKGLAHIAMQLHDVGDDGIAFTKDDIFVGKDTTDTAGKYAFPNISSGTYYLKLTPPPGYVSSTGNGPLEFEGKGPYETGANQNPNNDIDNNDDGYIYQQSIVSPPFHLVLNGEPINDGDSDANTNMTIDFGLFKPVNNVMSIGNLVFHDKNNNGTFDTGEAGIEGVRVECYFAGGDGIKPSHDDLLVGEDTTDVNGHYSFEVLKSGTYFVMLHGYGIPSGFVSSTGNGPLDFSKSGAFEPASGTNQDVDHNDDGTGMAPFVLSDYFDMNVGTESIQDGDTNPNTNFTVDFGLYKPGFNKPVPTCKLPMDVQVAILPTKLLNNAELEATLQINTITGSDKVGLSVGSSYAGPDYTSAMTILNAPPAFKVTSKLPAAGGLVTLRFFNGNNTCFVDQTLEVKNSGGSGTWTPGKGN